MNFSFTYNNKPFNQNDFNYENGEIVCTVDENVYVRVERCEYSKFDSEHYTIYFENKSSLNSGIFENILDYDEKIDVQQSLKKEGLFHPSPNFPSIGVMNGILAEKTKDYCFNTDYAYKEFEIYKNYIQSGETKTFSNTGARSSDGLMPFFDINSELGGKILAIGWTGGWKAEFERKEDVIFAKAGLKTARFYLEPGESVRTASILIMNYDASEDRNNKFRRLLKNHFTPKNNRIFAYDFWGSVPTNVMKERLGRLKENGISFEQVWLDAFWFADKNTGLEMYKNDPLNNGGDWVIRTDVHPDLLLDVKDACKDIGAGLMLWIEPESPTSELAPILESHPQWFIDKKLLNLGIDEAFDHTFKYLCNIIDHLGLSCLRQDFCMCPDEQFKNGDTENREGMTQIKHICALYKLWDKLTEKYPHLIIDNCASGGRRIDIETLKRSIPFFKTDYLCLGNPIADIYQKQNIGISSYISTSGCTTSTRVDKYLARSAYSSSFAITCHGSIDTVIKDSDYIWIKEISDEYLRIRDYFQEDFYNLGSKEYDPTAWVILQFHNPETQKGIVMAFRRENSPHSTAVIELKGLVESAEYVFDNFNENVKTTGGNVLTIELSEKRTSNIFEYEPKK